MFLQLRTKLGWRFGTFLGRWLRRRIQGQSSYPYPIHEQEPSSDG